MRRKLLILLLVLVAFCAGVLSSSFLSPVEADKSLTLNRSDKLKYDLSLAERKPVFINTDYEEDPYYHGSDICEFAYENSLSKYTMIEITTYEAVERGFKPCPDCVYEYVRIK